MKSYNFNSNEEGLNPDYELFKNQVEEFIYLYGVPVKYIKTSKINVNDIFGEHSKIKIDNENIFDLYVRIDDNNMFENEENIFDKFGLQDFEMTTIFIAYNDMLRLYPNIVNYTNDDVNEDNIPVKDLIVFESGKIMEVVNFSLFALGRNNIFTSNRLKNVFKLTLKSYMFNYGDISNSDEVSLDSFDDIFDDLLNENNNKIEILNDEDEKDNSSSVFGDYL